MGVRPIGTHANLLQEQGGGRPRTCLQASYDLAGRAPTALCVMRLMRGIRAVKTEFMSDDAGNRWASLATSVLFAAITLFILEDIFMDMLEHERLQHLVVEFLNLLTAICGLSFALWRMGSLRHALVEARADAHHWQLENRALVQGLGVAISRQFAAWGLSDAEAEIGLLLLKGLSLHEIADLRQTSERTVREQARSVYRKGGLSGRNQLAAYFLEDLLPPSLPIADGPDTSR